MEACEMENLTLIIAGIIRKLTFSLSISEVN
jgi:hypothetical protein